MGGRKTFYTVGGTGRKIVEEGGKFKYTAPGKFNKTTRNRRPILGNESRINDSIVDNTLHTV